MNIPYQLRPATMEDKNFMMYLEKVNNSQFPEIMKKWDDKYQKKYYENHFKPEYVSIIQYANEPIGAVSIITRRKEIFIVYLYLLPKFQNKGINASLIKAVMEKAQIERKPLMTCMYKEDFQTKRMFDNLGFEVFAEDDMRWRVKWIP